MPRAEPRYSPTTLPTKASRSRCAAREDPARREEGRRRASGRGGSREDSDIRQHHGLTSRTPWKTLKNTTKKTSVTPSATFDQIRGEPQREDRREDQPRIEFTALMNGSKTRARKGVRRGKAAAQPERRAMTKESIVSTSVLTRCWSTERSRTRCRGAPPL